MIEVLFAAWLAVIGVLVLTPAARAIPPWGAAFLAPLAATAIYTFSGLALVAVGSYMLALSVVLTTAIALAVVAFSAVKRMVELNWVVKTMAGAMR